MNKTAKLISGAALVLSLGGYASAGAFDELRSAVPAPQANTAELKVSAPSKATHEEYLQSVSYLTKVAGWYVPEFTEDLFADDEVTVVDIAPDSVLGLPSRPIVNEYAACSGFTVLASGRPDQMPARNWKTLQEYTVTRYEMLTAVRSLIQGGRLDGRLLEVTRLEGGYALKIKESPWGPVVPPPTAHQQAHQAGPEPHVPGTIYGAAPWLFYK